jgi:hypothetical protein
MKHPVKSDFDSAVTEAILLSEAQSVRGALLESYSEAKEHPDELFRFMEPYSRRANGSGVRVFGSKMAESLESHANAVAGRVPRLSKKRPRRRTA